MSGSRGGARRARSISRRVLVVGVVALIILSILDLTGVFSNGDAYGRLDIPGAKVLHFPKGRVEISFETQLGGTNGGRNLIVPALSLDVSRADGRGPDPVVVESYGSSATVNGDAHERVWKMAIVTAGDYRVTASGDVAPYIDPQLTFGREASLGGYFAIIWIAVVGALISSLVAGRIVKRQAGHSGGLPTPVSGSSPSVIGGIPSSPTPAAPPPPPRPPPGAGTVEHPDDAVLMRLDKLADLRERGALTDDEFATEKARILNR